MADKKFLFDGYPVIVGGRYGLGSKEFTPAMAKAVLDNLKKAKPKNNFVVGINDDVMNSSLDFDPSFRTAMEGTYEAMFFGLGSDGTVGANKNTIKIIGESTKNYTQAYFVYDSKKAGFIACHNFSFLEKYDMLGKAKKGGTFLLCSPFGKEEIWDKMPKEVQKQIIDKKLKFYVINAVKLGEELGLGARINMIMQTAFFKISNIIPLEVAVKEIKKAIKKSYGKSGDKVVAMNYAAVDEGLKNVFEVKVPVKVSSKFAMPPTVAKDAPKFVQDVIAPLIAGNGDDLPVSAMPIDGTFPTATAQYEKRNIAVDIPVWDEKLCIQCGICSFVCPHATMRMKAYPASALKGAPKTFKSVDSKMAEAKDLKLT